MQCAKNNLWKIIFVAFVLGVAFFGYKTSNKNAPTSIKVEIDENASAHTQHSSNISKQETEEIVKDFILQNPEVIIKSIELMHERKMKEMEDKIQNTIKDKRAEMEQSAGVPHAGKPNANNSIIMFYDYSCDYCKKANDVINQLLGYDDNIKVVYMPLPMLGEASEYIAKLMLATYKTAPDKFKSIHDEIIALHAPNKEEISAIITKHGFKIEDIEIEAAKPEVRDAQAKINSFASDLRIHGAPAFVIGNKFYPGFLELSQIQKVIADDRIKPQSEKAVVNEKATPSEALNSQDNITEEKNK